MTTNHLKLYHSFSSPNSRRVRMFLAEKGLTVPLAPATSPRASNPALSIRDALPTLVEDGTAIGEVLAIWRFEEVYPTPPLLGSTPKDKALVTMWERRTELEGFAVPFVAGNTFSAADITALVAVDFATKAMSFSAPGEHAAMERWYENVSSRPSVGA